MNQPLKRNNRRAEGEHYEALARQYLERHGLKFVAANFLCRGGEIDLIMREGAVWVFVEVKYRRTAAFGGALAAVNQRKIARLRHSVLIFLQKNGLDESLTPCRIDVVAITGDQYEWIRNAI
jgi:putative endonuclease